MNLRNLLLAASIHVAIAAIAQDNGTRTVTRNIDARNDNGECIVTITTTENGVTETQVLTGDEARAYMKENNTCQGQTGKKKAKGAASRASVMRYRYAVKDTKKEADDGTEVVVEMAEDDGASAMVMLPDGDGLKTLEIPADAFTFFPNPSNGACTMKYELPGEGDAVITIIDPSGREVYEERTSGRGPQTRTIDLTGKGPGEFVARLVQGGVTLLKKLVIE
jgi:hypothetical protein